MKHNVKHLCISKIDSKCTVRHLYQPPQHQPPQHQPPVPLLKHIASISYIQQSYRELQKKKVDIHKEELKLNSILKHIQSQCPHRWSMDPREYQSPISWTCTICYAEK